MRRTTKKPEHFWNHRVITRLYTFDYREPERTFSIAEVHYENDVAVAYGQPHIAKDLESVKAILWTLNRAKEALKKPILDADNWPHEWHEEKSEKSSKQEIIDQTLLEIKSF